MRESEIREEYVAMRRKSFARNPVFVEELVKRGLEANPYYPPQNYKKSGHEPALVDAVIASLRRVTDVTNLRVIVNHLGSTIHPYDGRVLTNLFEKSDDVRLRTDIAINLTQSNPQGIDEWIRERMKDTSLIEERRQFVGLSNCLQNTEGITDILLDIYSEMPHHVVESLSELGGEEELKFLKNQVGVVYDTVPEEYRKNYNKNLDKFIAKMEKRLAREARRKAKK